MIKLALNASAEKLLALAAPLVVPSLVPISGKASAYGFEYDFLAKGRWDKGILLLITEHMRRLASENFPLQTLTMMPQNAAEFLKRNQPLQAAFCADYPSNLVPLCKLKTFYDICPYDLLESSNGVKEFVLYELLQLEEDRIRIRGACFGERKELKNFVKRVDRALDCDATRLAEELGLISFADNLPLWHPSGMLVRQKLLTLCEGYYQAQKVLPFECADPKKGAAALYRSYPKIHQPYMVESEESDGLFATSRMVSELGFIYCSENQLQQEVISSLQFMKQMASILQVEWQFELLHRKKGPEGALPSALRALNATFEERQADVNAIEVTAFDLRGRPWTLSRLQVAKEPVVHLEFELFCSLERTVALLLEQNEGYLPLWLAPNQVRFLTLDQECVGWVEELKEKLEALGIATSVDSARSSLNEKMRLVHRDKVVCAVVVGQEELKKKKLSVRFLPHDKAPSLMDFESFLEKLKTEDKRNT